MPLTKVQSRGTQNVGAGSKNLVINGSMNVAQRGTSSTTSGYGSVDRFTTLHSGTDEAPTQAQVDVASGTTPFTLGLRKALKITNGNQTSGAGSADYIGVLHRLEGQDISSSGWDVTNTNSNLTISYWVKSSVAQTFYGRFRAYASSEYEYTYSFALSADTWTKVTKTIIGNSNFSSLVKTNAIGFLHEWQIFFGTDYTNNKTLDQWAVKDNANKSPDMTSTWYTTNDATFEITGVQLEVGSQASDFQHENYGATLLKCQRYFYAVHQDYGASSSNYSFVGSGIYYSSTNINSAVTFPIAMRAIPTATVNFGSSGNQGFISYTNGTVDYIGSSASINMPSIYGTFIQFGDGSGTGGHSGMVATQYDDQSFNFDAEL